MLFGGESQTFSVESRPKRDSNRVGEAPIGAEECGDTCENALSALQALRVEKRIPSLRGEDEIFGVDVRDRNIDMCCSACFESPLKNNIWHPTLECLLQAHPKFCNRSELLPSSCARRLKRFASPTAVTYLFGARTESFSWPPPRIIPLITFGSCTYNAPA